MQYISYYQHVIDEIVSYSGGPDKFAHMCVGLTIWLLSAILLRRPLYHWLPLTVVALLEGGNEVLDRIAYGSWRWEDTSRDIIATLFWPVVLAIALRFTPTLYRQADESEDQL
ncbi:MAG TPA: hypothetical protein VF503_26660 [Sphingobium sp.]|uniref:hypothetical protein n=1 Tax=Sphingobium sp. TaxID=1912891 RepID=UPI002ED1F967